MPTYVNRITMQFLHLSQRKKENKQAKHMCHRDWNRRDAEKEEDYPKTPVVLV